MSRDALAGLAEAARWRLLSLLLERPRPGWREEIAALAVEVSDASLAAAAAAARTAREGAYLALLGPGAPVSPREVAHRGLADPGWVLADLRRFYGAFAYRPRTEDPPDHVAVEAGFVGYLLLKEEAARTAGDEAAAQATAAGREAFVATHLAAIAAPLARALAGHDGGYVAAAAAWLAARVPVHGSAAEGAVPSACDGCAGATREEAS